MNMPEPSENAASPEEIEQREGESRPYGGWDVPLADDDTPNTRAELPYDAIAADLTPEQRRRVTALNEARDVLVGDGGTVTVPFGSTGTGDKPYTTPKRYTGDLLLLAEYIMRGLLPGEVEELALPDYPYVDGETTVIGPEAFVSEDGAVLNWRGTNYTPQEGEA